MSLLHKALLRLCDSLDSRERSGTIRVILWHAPITEEDQIRCDDCRMLCFPC